MPGPSPSSSNDSTNIPELRSAVIRSSDTRAEDELYFVNTPMTGRKHSQNSSALFDSDRWKPAQCSSSPDTESLERLVSTITTVFRPKSRHQQSGCVNDGEQWGDGRRGYRSRPWPTNHAANLQAMFDDASMLYIHIWHYYSFKDLWFLKKIDCFSCDIGEASSSNQGKG